ncbi:hypothetical protein MOO45_02370 [Bombilactobacillus folatiphilus]|uniref:Uncharacterized protein n=1 Tax=Bombilactobacillus folatiphilus TaxID=2923362 RepID=A0ABY4PAF1_9LACO|nr:hypothetical protein [Bombilactobacillus folatiphilus]UQS82516.1 hypothetical protein MOO45_02370 [Bombilactobacillus folatiphilus]
MATKTAPPEITPNMIDDGFNSSEYTQEEQAMPTDNSDHNLSFDLANNSLSGMLLRSYSTILDSSEREGLVGKISEYGHELFLLNRYLTFDGDYGLWPAVDAQNVSFKESLTLTPYHDTQTVINNPHARGKFYLIKDQAGQVQGVKWLNYSSRTRVTGGNIPQNAFLMEELLTPSKSSSFGIDDQLFVKNVTNATYAYGVDYYGDTYGSLVPTALGNNQGFTAYTNGNQSKVTVRTKVADGPNRYFPKHDVFVPYGYDGLLDYLIKSQGTSFNNYVGEEAGNYPKGTALNSGQTMNYFELLWPLQQIAPQETQRHRAELELEPRGAANRYWPKDTVMRLLRTGIIRGIN